jgi:superfamily II DNA/RNA helicase
VAEAEYTPTHAFSDFPLHPLLQTNLQAKGYAKPSPIQDQTVPLGLQGRDVVGIAHTGTGKTAAFGLPLLHRLMTESDTYALILAPTRELAQQIEEQCRSLAKGSGLKGALLIGGTAMRPQLRDLKANPRIVIGTPGRIKDHTEQGSLRLSRFNLVVLDEVDRMLDMGFINDIRHILSLTASQKQSFFFSATLDARVKTIIESFSADPVHVMVKTGETSDYVDQNIVRYAHHSEKLDKLHDLLLQGAVAKTLVFDDTHRSVEKLCKELQARGFETDAIHGGKSQSQRQRALKRFRDNQVKVLVATDVAARGLDVADITHVVNYSLPQSYGDYVHRIGRAGRAGRLGYALTFVEG